MFKQAGCTLSILLSFLIPSIAYSGHITADVDFAVVASQGAYSEEIIDEQVMDVDFAIFASKDAYSEEILEKKVEVSSTVAATMSDRKRSELLGWRIVFKDTVAQRKVKIKTHRF